jgi:hypothetical protein
LPFFDYCFSHETLLLSVRSSSHDGGGNVPPNTDNCNQRRTIEDVRGPPITVACDCGELKQVPYGETWKCEVCGRRWNTAQIPFEDYWGIMRDIRRMRLSVIGVAVLFALVFGLLGLLVSPGLFLLLPVVLPMWFIWYMPWWRRKLRTRVRVLPKWKLHPE